MRHITEQSPPTGKQLREVREQSIAVQIRLPRSRPWCFTASSPPVPIQFLCSAPRTRCASAEALPKRPEVLLAAVARAWIEPCHGLVVGTAPPALLALRLSRLCGRRFQSWSFDHSRLLHRSMVWRSLQWPARARQKRQGAIQHRLFDHRRAPLWLPRQQADWT